MTDDKLKEDTQEWLTQFFVDHFPEGMSEGLGAVMGDVLLEAYCDGVRYGQEIAEMESRIAKVPGHLQASFNSHIIRATR